MTIRFPTTALEGEVFYLAVVDSQTAWRLRSATGRPVIEQLRKNEWHDYSTEKEWLDSVGAMWIAADVIDNPIPPPKQVLQLKVLKRRV